MIEIFIWVTVAVLGAVLYFRKKYSHFKSHGINHLSTVPVMGNQLKPMIRQEHSFVILDNLYHAFPNDRFVGLYEFMTPTIVVRDIELIKSVAVKDFDYFTDHRSFTSENDPFLSKSLFGMKGQKWRDMRSTLSPAFTASKLRSMVPFMQECCKDMEDFLVKETENSKDGKVFNMRDLLTRYANDVIATCAFGLKTNSISDRENDFFTMGTLLSTIKFAQFLKIIVTVSFPFVEKFWGADGFSKKAVDFFRNIFLGTIKRREENNIYRPDMLQLLMEAQKGSLKHDNVEEKDAGFATVMESEVGKRDVKEAWDDSYIVAQALLFFFAGFDTVSTVMLFLFHELAVNPEAQERLQQEIDETLAKHNGKLDYDKINKMKYLDMCISETLRKWPPVGFSDRVCVKNYNLGKPNDKAPSYTVSPGTYIMIPVYSIHRDEKYYANPEKFDPERFSEENKHNINAFNYMPFGIGPRNCIGSRFALIEIKALAIALLRLFDISPSATTKVPLRLNPSESFTSRLESNELTFKHRKIVS